MKLHLPVRLFKSVLACLAAVASFSLGSGVAWAEVQNLIFNGTTLTWDTSEDNTPFVDAEGAAASFAAGDNVSFTGESAVTLGENITAGTLDIAAGADVTIDLEEYTLHTDTISLSGTLAVGDSLSIASGSTLAVKNAAAVLDSALVLGEKSGLVVESSASLNNNSLTLHGGSNLILTAAGDGKTYTLFSGISSLVDKNGNTLTAGSYSINDYFDKDAPGSGFWADATLVYTADGSLQIVRHNETVKAPLEITESKTGPQDYNYYKSISFLDCSIDGVDGDNIELKNNGSVTFSGNTASSDRAIFVSVGGTIMLCNNGSVEFSRYTASSGGAILGYGTDSTELSNNGSVTFKENMAFSTSSYALGGAICGTFSTIELSNNGRVEFCGNKTSSSSYHAYGGAIYGDRDIDLAHNGSVWFSGNEASSSSSPSCGGAIYSVAGGCSLTYNDIVSFRGNKASSTSSTAFGGAIYGANRTDVTLLYNGSVTFSGNTASSGSDDAWGGAIYGRAITLSNNGSVTFSGNTASASSSYKSSAYGGAIDGGTITLSNNGSVTFSGNTASASSPYSDSYAYAHGGAIHGETITLSNNGSVTFSGNTASGSSSSSSHDSIRASASGGAIHGETITLSHNGSVTFSGNTASASSSFSYYAGGGAIYGGNNSSITLSNNGSVSFSGNTASGSSARGGAIFASVGFSLKINNNGETIFRGNYAHSPASHAVGGAIYSEWGIFSIQNNASVVFEKNYTLREETLRLQSICASDAKDAYEEMLVNFSAPKGGKIEFRDSILISAMGISNFATAFHLNNWYVNDAGEKVAQTGDIIFTGEDATAENLKAILAEHGIHREATADEIRLSKTSEVWGIMHLHDGRLIVRDGAIIGADGITVHGSASRESTPTLWLDNGELTSNLDSNYSKNAVTISGGSALRLSGQNTARTSTLTLSAGSTFIIDVAAAHTTTAALTLNDSTLSLGGTITLKLNAAEGLNTAGHYMLLSGVSAPTDWASNITVSGGVWTIDDLSWVNNTLYLNFPTLTEATWNNQSGDRLWNVNSSVNWEQHDIDYAYKDGIGVIFGDEGAGKVTLVGTLTPASVLVNSTGNYSFEGSGSLSGGMTLTKQGSGTLSISTANSYTGGTVIDGGSLTITHANALGTGGIETKGNSSLVVNGVTLKLQGTIDNTAGGELSLKGALDASALAYTYQSDTRVSLDGLEVEKTKSGFGKDGQYQVVIVNGGTTKNEGVMVQHDNHRLRIPLMLGADGVAYASMAGVDYSRYHLTGDDRIAVSEIADVSYRESGMDLVYVDMDSGTLEVDQSIEVNATGGSIDITKAATLSGTVEDTAVSTAADDYSSEISALLKGDTTLEVNGGTVTVSGDNSYSGGTVVNGGALFAGHDNAFGAGDVTVNEATLDLNRFSIANKVLMNGNSTLGHADGAAHIVLGGGSKVNFRDGFTLSSGKVLEVDAGGATYTGALTLGGGTIELDGKLTVQGDVVFESGKQTTIDISDWTGAGDGEVLVVFGSNSSGYTNDSLALSGIAGDWELKFDSATGNLVLAAVRDDFSPNLDRNQQVVYDTIKDIMGEGNPGGLLGELGKEVTGTRDEEMLEQLLDELGGAEYATLMSGQQAAASGHMRRLRGEMGSGHLLAGTKTRAYIEAYNHRSEVDGDAHGRGYELNESGGQFALEFLGEDSVSGGFAVAAGRSKLQPDGGMTQKSDNTYVDAFVLHRDGSYTGKFSLGVGVHKYDLDRRVAGNAVSADTSGSSVNFMHESAWAMSLAESHSVQVFGAVESSFNKLGAFHEKGADTASLQVESQDAWVTTLSLGARYLYSFAALESAPAATLSVQGGLEFDFGDTESEVEMNFEGARSHSFRQSGAERDTFGYNLGASLHLPVSARAAIYASGDAALRGNSYEVNANAGLQMAF